MRRGTSHTVEKYINIRIDQLKEDMAKAHNRHDRMWYNRLIQELSWVKDQQHDCYIGSDANTDWRF